MTTVYVDPTRHAETARLIRSAFPGFAGKRVSIETLPADGAFTFSGAYWQEGCRSVYVVVDLVTGQHGTIPGTNPLTDRAERATHVPPGFVVVEHHHDGRYGDSVVIHARPDNMTPFLPPASDLTHAESIVLIATASLKNTYGGKTGIRKNAARAHGVDGSAWDAATATLKTRGMLNAAGSITADGRNAIASHPLRNRIDS